MLTPRIPSRPHPQPLKHTRYPWWDTDMTVCIAAANISNDDPLIVMCMDMMASADFSSAETTFKWRPIGKGFYALLSGPISTARELASRCHLALLDAPQDSNMNEIMRRLRRGIGEYKNGFAEAHLQSRLGMPYAEFRKRGRAELPEDLHREISLEIKNHYSNAELIVAGFLDKKPVIFKVSSDSVWSCDDFAVIGSGTLIAEASLYHREQSFILNPDLTIYHVYEAKRLAEKAPGVGRKTYLNIVRPEGYIRALSARGIDMLDEDFSRFSPRPVQARSIPDELFMRFAMPGATQDRE